VLVESACAGRWGESTELGAVMEATEEEKGAVYCALCTVYCTMYCAVCGR